MSATSFGDELRRLRRAAGLNLLDLAEASNLSLPYISQIERDVRRPPSEACIRTLLVRMGCEAELPRMLNLATKARSAVEIGLKGKSVEVTDMLIALARKTEQDEIDPELAQQILDLLKPKKGE